MKSFFLKSNLVLYSTHLINFVFGYLLILICTNYLDDYGKFQFTGFMSLLNIFLIPISCLVLSLTGLYKNGKKSRKNYSIIYSKSIVIFFGLIFLMLALNYFFDINKFLQINIENYFFIISLLLINFFYSIENAENLAEQKFFKYSIINTLPFLIRFFLAFIFLISLNYESFKIILIIYMISFSFLIIKYFKRLKMFFSIKNIYISKKIKNLNFFKNLITLSIFSIVINIDIVASRYVDAINSTEYYVESLFGKIIFFLGTIAVLFMYPTNVQKSNKNFLKILMLNLLASFSLILFYYFFFEIFYKYLFPNMQLDIKIVLFISLSSLLFSVSNLVSYKLNILGFYFHSLLKLILTAILIIFLFGSDNNGQIINNLIIFSIIFVLIDLIFFSYHNKKIIL